MVSYYSWRDWQRESLVGFTGREDIITCYEYLSNPAILDAIFIFTKKLAKLAAKVSLYGIRMILFDILEGYKHKTLFSLSESNKRFYANQRTHTHTYR